MKNIVAFGKRNWIASLLLALCLPTVLLAAHYAHIEVGLTTNTISDAELSGAIGTTNDLTDARYSLTVGLSNQVGEPSMSGSYGYGNLAVGRLNEIDADYSMVTGRECQVVASRSGAVGYALIVDDPESFAVGASNDPTSLTSSAAFVVGNGPGRTESGPDSNAFIVYHNGDVCIPKAQGDVSMGGYQ